MLDERGLLPGMCHEFFLATRHEESEENLEEFRAHVMAHICHDMPYIALYYPALPRTTLHYPTMPCNTLHCPALPCTALHGAGSSS